MTRDVFDTGLVDDRGLLMLDHKERFVHALKAFAGRRVVIRVYEPVSSPQRGYYFSAILPAAAVAMAQDRPSTHLQLKEYVIEHGLLDYDTGQVLEMPPGADSFEVLSSWSFRHVLTELKLLVRDFLGGPIE